MPDAHASAAVHPATTGVPDDLRDAFWRYDDALRANDLDALDELFARRDDTVRVDPSGTLVGWDAISAFRRSRPQRATRVVTALHAVRVSDDVYVLSATTHVGDRGPGSQTQVWERTEDGWRVRAAHVSAASAPADATTWRVHATPLVPATGSGPLNGLRLAVKDLYAVAGHRVGAGVPAALAEAEPESDHAAAVSVLLSAGASIAGIAQCDEFAFGLEGANAHYGTSRNPRSAVRLPGGSSSGSASAVATGGADIGLATDTAGSVRVPASFQGLWGLRTTHGAVPRDGLRPLAPSFDTVGWITRDAASLLAVLDAHGLASDDAARAPRLVRSALLDALAGDAATALDALFGESVSGEFDPGDAFDAWFAAFRLRQAYEAWEHSGAWIQAHPGALSPDVEARFRIGSTIDAAEADAATRLLADARARIVDALGDGILVAPTASGPAPLIGAPAGDWRDRTLRLGALAAIAGLPALSAPQLELDGLPVGVTYFGAPGRDADLVRAASRLRTKE